jgi:transcriptional regulator with XRE-family HTH domain
MVREPLTVPERERGERLGEVLRRARGSRSIVDAASAAGISPETLRKIERGRIPTPAFFTVVAVAEVLGLSLDALTSVISAPPATDGVAPGAGVHVTEVAGLGTG